MRGRIRGLWRAGVALALAVSVGCGPRAVAPPAPASPATRFACLEALGQSGALFEPVAAPASAGACRVDNAVALRRSTAAVEPAATLACPMALSWAAFDRDVVQPAALRRFGRPVRAVRQIGAYSCRHRGGTSRLSQHAFGQAIDVAAFELEGGARVSVKEHWRERGPRGDFLRDIARAACASFSVVLTPDSDADHADHVHLDIGRDRLCVR